MIALTERQMAILKLLRKSDRFITVRTIANYFRVSERSIHYDLNMVKSFLQDLDIHLTSMPNKGLMLKLTPKQRVTIKRVLQQATTFVLSGDNLTRALAIRIIFEQTTTLNRLGLIYKVSRSKIYHYIPDVNDLIKKYGLMLEKKPSKGISIIGNEFDIRCAFGAIASEFLEKSYIGLNKLLELFSHEAIDRSTQLIERYERQANIQFSDEAKRDLLLNLCFQFRRISDHQYVQYPDTEIKRLIENPKFPVVEKIFKLFSSLSEANTVSGGDALANQPAPVTVPMDEIVYSLNQFKLSKISLPLKNTFLSIDKEAQQASLYFAREASKVMGVDFTSDDEFIRGLSYHLQVSLYRIKNHLPIENSLTEQVKYKFRFIYEITRKIIIKMERLIDVSFPEDEIAYIAMHLGASYDRHPNHGFTPSALVICGSGLATSSLLASRLRVMMPEIKIKGPINLASLEHTDISKVDFIVSTVPINFNKKKVIVVNPLLESNDLAKLRKIILKNVYEKQISELLKINQCQPSTTLGALIPTNCIQLKRHIFNWREAIISASRPLLDQGNITQNYVDAMINAVEKLGPYMVFIPSVAMVHASYKDGVRKNGISLLTLAHPIHFGDRTNVKVSIVFVMCSTSANSDYFIKLVNILDHKENRLALNNAEYPGNILHLK